MKPKLADLRKSYEKGVLSQKDVMNDPIQLFQSWFNEAKEADTIDEANAMSLCTLSTDGFPRARVVLLKDYSKEGFVFFTNLNSNISTLTNLNTNLSAVTTVNSNLTAIATNNSNATNINAVASANTNITNVANALVNINQVAGNLTGVTSFADIYLGAASSNPTTDADGSALEDGDLYFNTTYKRQN